jgi:hypothetical protein
MSYIWTLVAIGPDKLVLPKIEDNFLTKISHVDK